MIMTLNQLYHTFPMRQKYVSESVVASEVYGLSGSVVSEFDLAEASVSSMRDNSDNPGVPNLSQSSQEYRGHKSLMSNKPNFNLLMIGIQPSLSLYLTP